MRSILGVEGAPENAQVVSQLPFALGGLILMSAVRSNVAAHWSSWADCVHMIKQRHPQVAENVDHGHSSRPFAMIRRSEALSRAVGRRWVGRSIVEEFGRHATSVGARSRPH